MSNIEKVKKMMKGVYNRPIQVGYQPKTIDQRKEGEVWEEPSGREFTIENGKRKQLTKVPPKGFDKCKDCEKLILKTIDQQTYNRMQKCQHCQMEFEATLHREGKWNDWVAGMEKKRWDGILKEYKQEINEFKEKNQFDKTVANSLASHEHRK